MLAILRSLPMALCAVTALGQVVPTGFTIEVVATVTTRPNDLCFLPDGRCLVAGTEGTITLIAGTTATVIGTVANVEYGGERGLLSIAADPDFGTNGQFYVYYSHSLDAFMHLDRFTCTGDLANGASTNLAFATASRRVILDSLPDTAVNHNGGSVRFGPDGMLHLSVGDDSWNCIAQSLTSQCGCLLRLDVRGVPPGGGTVAPTWSSLDPGDNPLSGTADFRRLLLAIGLRNPFRMEIDPLTGNVYLGDVGHDLVEEVSEYVRAGASDVPLPLVLRNFGWPWREGNVAGPFPCAGGQPPDLVEPIVAEPIVTFQASIMVGSRYRSLGGAHDFGARYDGDLFYLDFFTGNVRRLRQAGAWAPAPPVPGQPTALDWGTGFTGVCALRQGPDGALWYPQHWPMPWRIRRVRPVTPPNTIAVVSGAGQRVPAGEPFPQPLAVRVQNAQGQPVAGAAVHFELTGPGTLSTTNPVLTDGGGNASTTVTAGNTGGPLAVVATTSGAVVHTTIDLFVRKLAVVRSGSWLVIDVRNTTAAAPPLVPYVLMVSLPGSPPLPTPMGTLCIDPAYPLAFVIEDGTGTFGYFSLSGTGGVGNPSLTKVYSLPPALFAGQLMSFQAIGYDPLTGGFRTNCERVQF